MRCDIWLIANHYTALCKRLLQARVGRTVRRLETFVRGLSLENLRLETFDWGISCWNIRLGSSAPPQSSKLDFSWRGGCLWAHPPPFPEFQCWRAGFRFLISLLLQPRDPGDPSPPNFNVDGYVCSPFVIFSGQLTTRICANIEIWGEGLGLRGRWGLGERARPEDTRTH
jgi:hypothetical protein